MPKITAKNKTSNKVFLAFLVVLLVSIGVGFGIFITKKHQFVSKPANQNPEYLFLQQADSGSLVPVAGEADMYTLTLKTSNNRTLFFTDRPRRVVGVISTTDFVSSLWNQGGNSFQKDPPNAALTISNTATGNEDTTILEISHPMYDVSSHTLSYTAKALDPKENKKVVVKNALHASDFPTEFVSPTLYIDPILATEFEFELPLGYRDSE